MDLAAETVAAQGRARQAQAELARQRAKLARSEEHVIEPLRRHVQHQNHLAELAMGTLARKRVREGDA